MGFFFIKSREKERDESALLNAYLMIFSLCLSIFLKEIIKIITIVSSLVLVIGFLTLMIIMLYRPILTIIKQTKIGRFIVIIITITLIYFLYFRIQEKSDSFLLGIIIAFVTGILVGFLSGLFGSFIEVRSKINWWILSTLGVMLLLFDIGLIFLNSEYSDIKVRLSFLLALFGMVIFTVPYMMNNFKELNNTDKASK
jgi:hypothetical protein